MPRSTAIVPWGIWLFLSWLIVIPVLMYLGLRWNSAQFVETISPGGEFRILLPGDVKWTPSGEPPFTGPSGVGTRSGDGHGLEVYRLRSEPLSRRVLDRDDLGFIATQFVNQDSTWGRPLVVYARRHDRATGCWYVDFEWRRSPGERGAGRVLLTDRHLVFLTVVGSSPMLTSDRVEKFFDSFRLLDY